VFAVAIVLAILGPLVLIGLIIYKFPPDVASPSASALIRESVAPLLERVATFAATVFGPLLAFVLGYYFGEKAK